MIKKSGRQSNLVLILVGDFILGISPPRSQDLVKSFICMCSSPRRAFLSTSSCNRRPSLCVTGPLARVGIVSSIKNCKMAILKSKREHESFNTI